jgi:hypothetical protein
VSEAFEKYKDFYRLAGIIGKTIDDIQKDNPESTYLGVAGIHEIAEKIVEDGWTRQKSESDIADSLVDHSIHIRKSKKYSEWKLTTGGVPIATFYDKDSAVKHALYIQKRFPEDIKSIDVIAV